jgi:hypothetical protein
LGRFHGFTIDKKLQRGAVTGINHDYGIFDSPDAFYAKHGANLSGPRRMLYTYAIRHLMNATVARIRRRGLCAGAGGKASGMLRA